MENLNELEVLKKNVADLSAQISRYELSEQRMRSIQHKLDTQIETFKMIHAYTQQAFRARTPEALKSVIAEGIADIFQLEIGAVLILNPDGDALKLTGSFNFDDPDLVIPLAEDWIQSRGFQGRIEHSIISESPVADDSPLAALGLAHAIYVSLIDYDRTYKGIIVGGVSKSGERIFDFKPTEMMSSFMVYCQQMNGIYNGFFAMEKAKDADRAKTVFLANLSHEMRTPLNAIIGMAQISRMSETDGKKSKEISQIEISSKHLLNLINDILEIAKIEEGKLELVQKSFCLKEITENLLVSSIQAAEDKRQNFTVNISTPDSCTLIGDSMRLSQVLLNLLSNAIKFTPVLGKIDFCVEEISRDTDNALIRFSVLDTGIGIHPEFMESLFLPFEQGDSSILRKYGGTGLGLAISQRIVRQMGSEIKVVSEVGKGTEFYFSILLPIDKKPEDTNDRVTVNIPDLSDKTVLVVDDVEINREIVCFLLEQTGITCEVAQNGKIALDMFAQSAEGHYDLILMDIQMPLMDGYTATREIRAMDRPDAKKIVILAMTANAFKEDIDQAVKSGMNGHISKPVDETVLLRTIGETLLS